MRDARWELGMVAVVLVACGSSGSSGEVRSDMPANADHGVVSELVSREAREQADATQAADAARSERYFGLRFLKQLPADRSLVFSPHDLSRTFAKLTDAAEGATLQQIQQAFGFGTTDESFHRSQNALSGSLAERNREPVNDGRGRADAVVLKEASDVWLSQATRPHPSYLDTLALYYGGGVHLADFQGRPEDVRKAINSKIELQTNELIPELLPADSVTDETVLVLTSALYFKAPWATPFPSAIPGEFQTLSGDRTTAPMLNRTLPLGFYAGERFVSVSVPYVGNQLGMLLVVPDEGAYESVRDALSEDVLDAIVKGTEVTAVDLTLPKFAIQSDVAAKASLQKLGVEAAFERGAASFPKLTAKQVSGVFVSDVVHKATVSVDEQGTEASAATAVLGAAGGSAGPPPEPKVVTVDRPFLFTIRDNVTGSLLFVGQVVSP